MSEDLWIVGKIDRDDHLRWEFMGVFDDQTLAESACKNYQYFVGPAKLNERLPDEPAEWPGAYTPLWDVP